MTNIDYIIIALLLFVLLNVGFYLFAIYFAAYQVHIHTLKRNSKEQFSRENPELEGRQVEMDQIGLDWMEQHRSYKQDVHIQRDGFNLYGEYFDFGYDRAVFILSGRTDTLRYGYYFAIPYAKNGYNVLVADPRAHGLSDGTYITVGFEEGKDAIEWARLLHEELGNREVLFHGICIGGAGGLLALTDPHCPEYIVGLVAEGMFVSFSATMENHLIERKKNLWLIMPAIDFWLRRATGHSMFHGPIDVMPRMTKPLLMLHSKQDRYCTAANAQVLYDLCPSPHKHLELFEDGPHSQLRVTDTDGYDRAITRFVQQYFAAESH